MNCDNASIVWYLFDHDEYTHGAVLNIQKLSYTKHEDSNNGHVEGKHCNLVLHVFKLYDQNTALDYRIGGKK